MTERKVSGDGPTGRAVTYVPQTVVDSDGLKTQTLATQDVRPEDLADILDANDPGNAVTGEFDPTSAAPTGDDTPTADFPKLDAAADLGDSHDVDDAAHVNDAADGDSTSDAENVADSNDIATGVYSPTTVHPNADDDTRSNDLDNAHDLHDTSQSGDTSPHQPGDAEQPEDEFGNDVTAAFDPSQVVATDDPASPDADVATGDFAPLGSDANLRVTQTAHVEHPVPEVAVPEFSIPEVAGIRILEELGRGGMGVVYRAHDEKLNSEVALKTLLRMGPDDLTRFKQEFRGLADIAHPNLASLYELHSDGTTWCLTMELLEGVEFLDYVWSELDMLKPADERAPVAEVTGASNRLTPARLERLHDVLKQMALGLNELHRAGKLHSDIKPSNVFVTTDGRLVLLDFGLIAEITRDEEGRMPKSIQGTPLYMAPEQAACRPLTGASDWYAVGVMLYEALTGRPPFDGPPIKVMLRKQMEKPVAPVQRRPDVPPELNDLCMALLDVEPKNRPGASDVLRALGADFLADHILGADTTRDSVELVGREQHFAELHRTLVEVADGATRSVFVHGFSGMGKSVLIQSFLETVRRNEQAVLLEGRCYEQESVPFKALDSLVDSLVLYLKEELRADECRTLVPQDTLPLVRLFPVFGQVPGADETDKPPIDNADQNELRQRALMTLRELLVRLSDTRTVVLYIDDLQWGDDDSAHLLADLVRPPHSPPILLLGSYRREELESSSALRALEEAYKTGVEHPHRDDLAVDNLSETDATRLALTLIGRDRFNANKIAARIARESGGSPFFVWELAQHVEHAQDDTASSFGTLELDEVIWSRVTRLPPDTRLLLEAFAVCGRPMPAGEAYRAIGRTNGPSLLAQLRTNDFVRTTERDGMTLVESYHDRIRESVVDHISAEKVASHNLRIAEVIEENCGFTLDDIDNHIYSTLDYSEPAEPMNLSRRQWQRVFDMAYFFDAAGQTERALPYALIAAERAWKQNAFEVAEQQFEIARRGAEIQLAPRELRFRIAEGLGDTLTRRAKYERAILHLEAARYLADGPLVQARVDSKIGWVAYKTGDMEVSNDHFHRALAETGMPMPRNIFRQLLALSRQGVTQLMHSLFPGSTIGKRGATTTEGETDLFRAELYDGLGYPYFFSRGPIAVLLTHLHHMNLSERYVPGQILGRAYAYHAVVMTAIPLAGRGASYADRAYSIHGAHGDRFGQGKARSFKSMSLNAVGRFAEAVESGREAQQLLEEAGDVWELNMARILTSVPTYYLGELEEAYTTAQTALKIGYETGDQMAIAVALFFGSPTRPDFAPEGVIQEEMERPRQDPLSTCAIIQARGLEQLLREDDPVAAAETINGCLDLAWRKMFRNPFIYCGYAWRAEALRLAAEREPEGAPRARALRLARKAANRALWVTKLYHTSRSQALREMGSIHALEGRASRARSYFEESLRVAVSQQARFEQARTQLAHGQAGVKFGWADAERQVAEAQDEIDEITSFWRL